MPSPAAPARRFRHVLFAAASLLAACAHREAPPPAEAPTPHAASSGHGHGGTHGQGMAMPHRFEDAEAWAARFEDPARDAWQKPDEVVAALALPPDAKVADVGSGTGYFAVRLARAVPRGHVFGVDVEPDMARYLGERARREGLSNLTPVLATPDDPKLPEPVDLVLVVDTYHHIGDRVPYFRRLLQQGLTPEGRLAIVDFRPESSLGPPAAHKLAPDAVRAELEAAGFRQVQAFEFLPEQYFLLFARR